MTGAECKDPAHALLDWYLNGTLDGEEAASIAAHVRSCPICSRELAELASLTNSLAAHGIAPERAGGQPDRRAHRRPLAYALAAVLAVSMSVALYRVCQEPSTGPATPATSFALDLGHGPTRGSDRAPAWVIPAGTRSVAISFIAPVSSSATDTLELEGPDGAILLTDLPLGDRDPAGAYTYTFPSETFTQPGEYVILVRRLEAAGEVLEYRFPLELRLATPAD